jgi:GNAT superfamily N-acetyltransferase
MMRVQLLSPTDIDRLLPQIVQVFKAAYTPRPWYGSHCPPAAVVCRTFAQHRRLPGFRLAAALFPPERLVGFGYGYVNDSGQWFHDFLTTRLGTAFAGHWLTKQYQLVELAVTPAERRQGIGRALHPYLLDGVATRSVLAAVQPGTPGHLFAAKLNYETVAFDVWFPISSADQYVLATLRLPPELRTAN